MFKKITVFALAMHATSLGAVTVINNSSRHILFGNFMFHKTCGAQTTNVKQSQGEAYRAGEGRYIVPEKDREDWYVWSGTKDTRTQVRSMNLYVQSDQTLMYVYETGIFSLDDLVVIIISEDKINGSIRLKRFFLPRLS